MGHINELFGNIKTLYHTYGPEIGLATKLVVRALVPVEWVAEAVEEVFDYHEGKQQEHALEELNENLKAIGGDVDFLLDIIHKLKGELKPILEETLSKVKAHALDQKEAQKEQIAQLEQKISEHHIELRNDLYTQMTKQHSLLKRILKGQQLQDAQFQRIIMMLQSHFVRKDPVNAQTISHHDLSQYRHWRGQFDRALLSGQLPQAEEAFNEMSRLCGNVSLLSHSRDTLSVVRETLTRDVNVYGDQDWRLFEKLGEGGMGTVWRAQNRLNKIAALKLIRDDFSHNKNYQERFRYEIQTLESLEHPSIVKIEDWGYDSDREEWFLAMEFIDGISLSSYLHKNGNMDLALLKRVIAKIAEGLSVCHEQNIVHRDIKPANILLRAHDLTPVIIDFGIAGNADIIGETKIGTKGYASPEQMHGRSRLTPASDLYSLGVLIEECLGGVLDESLIRIIQRLKSQNPAQRGSATQIVADLSSVEVRVCQSPSPELIAQLQDLSVRHRAQEREQDTKALALNQVIQDTISHLKSEIVHDELRSRVKYALNSILRPHELPIEVLQIAFRSGDRFSSTKISTRVKIIERFINHPHGRFFLMLETPVTQALYYEITKQNPSHFKLLDHPKGYNIFDDGRKKRKDELTLEPIQVSNLPVEQVSWEDVAKFCNRLSDRFALESAYQMSSGKLVLNDQSNGFRLPSEAEWEFAARGGNHTPFAGSHELNRVGWYRGNAGGITQPVRSKHSNEFNLFDMTGNVWEMCEDSYDPKRPEWRACRGGSIYDEAKKCLLTSRVAYKNEPHRFIGFRVVRSLGKVYPI